MPKIIGWYYGKNGNVVTVYAPFTIKNKQPKKQGGLPPLYPMKWYNEVNKSVAQRRKTDLQG